jgi:hypothetical protein
LYRRFPVDDPDEDVELEVDMIELPDISCIRQKHDGRPQDALWHKDNKFGGWGVMQFEVRHIPRSIDSATKTFTFRPVHTPYSNLYPHTEVRAFDGNLHLEKALIETMDRGAQLRFREKLLEYTTVRFKPGEFDWGD